MAGWIVVRTMLVGDVMILVLVGFVCMVWVSQPAGAIGAILAWLGAGGLLALLPLTDPYRVQVRRAKRLGRPI